MHSIARQQLMTTYFALCQFTVYYYLEFCCKADHRSITSRTHHTDFASTSLAVGQTMSWIQDCQLGIPGAVKQSTYLADDMHLASSLRGESALLLVLRVVNFDERRFTPAGPRIWNNLPASLRDKEVSCTEFRKQLKRFMFQTDCGASWLFWLLRLINTLTYLLVTINLVGLQCENMTCWIWIVYLFYLFENNRQRAM